MNPIRKIILGLALGVITVLIVLALWPSPVPVSTIVVERGYFQEFVEEEGRTILREPYVLSVPVSGFMKRIEVDAGDPVEAGAVLIEIEPSPAPALDERMRRQARETVGAAQARLAQTEAELEARAADARYAEREFDRIQNLEAKGAIATAALDRAKSDLQRALGIERAGERTVEAALYELRNAEAVLEVTEGQRTDTGAVPVRSPVNGIVLRRHRWSEGPVQQGEAIVEIGNLSDLEVQVDLLSMDAVRVRRGMSAVLSRWGGERDLMAQVLRVEPAGFTRISALGVEEQRVPVLLRLEESEESWQGMGDGYRVEARFILWEDDQVLQVPASALFRNANEWGVFVVENGHAETRTVRTGRRSGLWVQILSGLDAGETVITHPGDRVTAGTRVQAEIGAYR